MKSLTLKTQRIGATIVVWKIPLFAVPIVNRLHFFPCFELSVELLYCDWLKEVWMIEISSYARMTVLNTEGIFKMVSALVKSSKSLRCATSPSLYYRFGVSSKKFIKIEGSQRFYMYTLSHMFMQFCLFMM